MLRSLVNRFTGKHSSSPKLYLTTEAKLSQLDLSRFKEDTLVLCPDEINNSSSSSGARKYNAYFIRGGKWLVDDKQILLKHPVGDCNFSGAKEGFLPTKNHVDLMLKSLGRVAQSISPLFRGEKWMIDNHVIPYYAPKEKLRTMHQLASTCRYAHSLFQPKLRVAKALHYSINGLQDDLSTMLDKDPHLVFARGEVTD